MHISLLTASGAYNLGDELILRTEYEYLCEHYPSVTFSLFTYDPKSLLPISEKWGVQTVSYFPNHLKKRPFANLFFLIQNIWHIARSDLIVIGGGGLIYDNERGQSFSKLLTEWKIRILIAKIFRVPIFYWSLGIHVSQQNRPVIAPLFRGKNIRISVRDRESQEILTSLGIMSTLLPDPVLLYDPEIPQLVPKHRPRIGLALRDGYIPWGLEAIERIITFLRARDYEVVILSHSLHPHDRGSDDVAFLTPLIAKYRLSSSQTISETLESYKTLDFVIAMRLHSAILSLVHEIPFLAISYSTKTDEFLRDIGYPYMLNARSLEIDTFKSRFLELETEKKACKFALSEKNGKIKGEIAIILKSLFDGLEKTQRGRESLGK